MKEYYPYYWRIIKDEFRGFQRKKTFELGLEVYVVFFVFWFFSPKKRRVFRADETTWTRADMIKHHTLGVRHKMFGWRMWCEGQEGDWRLKSTSKGPFNYDLWLTFNAFLIRG